MVGGIPLDRRIFPWSYPRPTTPFEGMYAIGDTVFPGQGIPGVVLGALSLRRRLQAEDR
jgi:phytoene dehydrogenase-like protein